jgi:hypothetical protein
VADHEDPFARERFAPLVGQTFAVGHESAAGWVGPELELVAVNALRPHSRRAEPFSLLFRGPRSPILPQSIYDLVHPALGTLKIFLVPVQPSGDGAEYEAVFN